MFVLVKKKNIEKICEEMTWNGMSGAEVCPHRQMICKVYDYKPRRPNVFVSILCNKKVKYSENKLYGNKNC